MNKQFIIISMVLIVLSCSSRTKTDIAPTDEIDTIAIQNDCVDTAITPTKFHLAFESQPINYTLRSLVGLDPTKHYKYIVKNDNQSSCNTIIINGTRYKYISDISDDSIDYVGPYDPVTHDNLLAYKDSTLAERDSLLFFKGRRNYIIRYPKHSKTPIDTIVISRERVFRAESKYFKEKEYKGSLYDITPLTPYRIAGDTVEFHFGYYHFDSDFGDLFRYRITNTGDTFFVDEEYYRHYGNAPFGIEPEEE